MTYEEAIKILHPDTLRGALAEIEYYNGFSGVEVAAKKIEDACLLACEAMEKQQAMTWRVVGYNEDGYLYNLPEDEQEILVSYQTHVAADIFVNYGEDGCYLESGECIEVGMAWMPLPEPYKGDKHPTAEVAPVVNGRWIHDGQDYFCNRCNRNALCDKMTGEEVLSSICPHCGAKMDGKGNE